ncbi:cysteine desulfurase-like protein [Microbacterium capsulatum]|uniref:Cysteine desulfurase-like protein n=1 Tax=Microbacterium capsulatum TaxID=3041921 RepID=A0ABU0XLX1_9MICO|nr:cysteine desulfurase-like protein [Microbacterium sp. ASV81]MDQ4215614.1 cysteine desulfurase-like protein [Microbacterium sp. ASV81]
MPAFPVSRIRAQFPSLREGSAFFDGPGGTQTPECVAAAIRDALVAAVSQRGRNSHFARGADRIVNAARAAMGDFLHVSPEAVVFGRSATQLTFDFSAAIGELLDSGDEIALSRLDHDANVAPWLAVAEAKGLQVRWIDFDRTTGEISLDDAARAITPRTRLVAIAAASNLLGTTPDIAAIAGMAHEVGALVYVDAVAYAAHELIDLDRMGADFVVCSSYKFCGPHLGILGSRPETLQRLHTRKLRPSTEQVPERFELGTLPYELLAGVTATVEFLAGLVPADRSRRERLEASYRAMQHHEDALRDRLLTGLDAIPGVTRIGVPPAATPTVLFAIDGVPVDEACRVLGDREIIVGGGTFYAYEAARWADLGDGGIRAGISLYTTVDDIDRLLSGVRDLASRRP